MTAAAALAPLIRSALAADAVAMAGLQNAIIARGGSTAHQRPRDPAVVAQSYIDGPECLSCQVALAPDGRLLGFQAVGLHPDLPPGWGDIGSYVADGLRGQGIGRRLFAATRGACRALGLVSLNATIRADNRLGLGFYAALGFVDYGHDPDFALQDGTVVGRVHRRLEL